MTETDFITELARRSGVSRDDANAVLDALGEMTRESAGQQPTSRDIHDLIAAAEQHPLGLEFLLHGQLCAVATMFRVHAFTVEAARQYIIEHGASISS